MSLYNTPSDPDSNGRVLSQMVDEIHRQLRWQYRDHLHAIGILGAPKPKKEPLDGPTPEEV